MTKTLLKVAAGFALFFGLVFIPLRANLTASVSRLPALDNQARAAILNMAAKVYPCAPGVFDEMGNALFMQNHLVPALMAYGEAIRCQPNNAHIRYKYGEVLLALGFLDGHFAIKEAAGLEPNNPFYRAELDRVTELQRQLR